MSGFVTIYRKLRRHWIWKRSYPKDELGAFIDLIMEVQHSDITQNIIIKNTVIECKRGQSVKSLNTWAERWGWDKSKVRRFFKLLEKDEIIRMENVQKTTRLTLCNYDTYQFARNDCETIVKRSRNDHETIVKPDNNDNKENNDKNENGKAQSFIDHWNSKPELPHIRAFNKDRQKKLALRMKDKYFSENWKVIIDKLADTPFCLGKNDRGWKADVSWLLANGDNHVKLMEGRYTKGTEKENAREAELIKELRDI